MQSTCQSSTTNPSHKSQVGVQYLENSTWQQNFANVNTTQRMAWKSQNCDENEMMDVVEYKCGTRKSDEERAEIDGNEVGKSARYLSENIFSQESTKPRNLTMLSKLTSSHSDIGKLYMEQNVVMGGNEKKMSELPRKHDQTVIQQQTNTYKPPETTHYQPVPPVSSVKLPKSEYYFNLHGYQSFQRPPVNMDKLDLQNKPEPMRLQQNPTSNPSYYSGIHHQVTNPTTIPPNQESFGYTNVIRSGIGSNISYPINLSPKLSQNQNHNRQVQHMTTYPEKKYDSEQVNNSWGVNRQVYSNPMYNYPPVTTESCFNSNLNKKPVNFVPPQQVTVKQEQDAGPTKSSGFINSYLSFVSSKSQDCPPQNNSSIGKSVTKLKKAWLQRHSDEDNVNSTLNSNISEVSNETSVVVSGNDESQNSVVDANVEEVAPVNVDESTESSSEAEMEISKSEDSTRREEDAMEKDGDVVCDVEQTEKKDDSSNLSSQPKKRGRKPKPKNTKEILNKPSKLPLSKKRNGLSFLQDGPCCDVAPKLNKCRECRITNQGDKMLNIFCRFFAFRRLRLSKNGYMAFAGFSEPQDATKKDTNLWLPQADCPPSDLNLETSKFILLHVGNQFCDLVQQEQEARGVHIGEDKTVAWKRVVQGVREMCDVCETTLFNYHWACGKCGFVVCIDCYKARKNNNVNVDPEDQNCSKDSDGYSWMLCNSRQPHEQDKLMLTQIIADNALWKVGKLLHVVRKRWNIGTHCFCTSGIKETKIPVSNGICKQLMNGVTTSFEEKKPNFTNTSPTSNGVELEIKPTPINYTPDVACSPLSWLADVALNASNNKLNTLKREAPTIKKQKHFSTLRELLIRPTSNNNNERNTLASLSPLPKKSFNTLDDIINCMIEHSVNRPDNVSERDNKLLVHYTRRYPQPRSGWDPLPVRIYTLSESQLLFPDVPHSWLCAGRLLRLHDPVHKNNLRLFQEQWKRGQPVLVSEVSRALDMSLWHPEAFARDFGDIKNDLVNCHTGNIVPDQPMRKFWEGFENLTKRMQDCNGEYMLLKLKDWPPGDDFSEMLPSRFEDLMKVLPLPEYTHRNGRLNLAGRLPDCFVRPDLGPKMYNAYGSALYPSKGTTNLHLDISDAVNVMVYVGIPKDGNSEQHIKEALRAIDEAGCDVLTRKRVREKHERPGALWHIYNARDADKIRDLLNKVAVERGEKLEPDHDPIHDQSWYLDATLRERLYLEYGVEGYAIAQCLGDAVFIPAGAPHQVRNLHSCIKVAEDFVSPENVSHCFTLTQEFRHLSDTHTNHEDKLQVKNIIYHAVKDALSVLLANEKQ